MGKTNITIKGYREKILRNRKSKGGGILIAKKDGSNINLTAVSIHESEEQLWVKVNTNIVIGIVYGYIESRTDSNTIDNWFYEIEKEYIKWEEHKTLIIGDMNVKIGNDEAGVEGNTPEVSHGGRTLRSMVERRNLTVMNNTSKCSGLWTREDPSGTKSVLDLVIANKDMENEIQEMIVDEQHNYKLSRTKKIKKEMHEVKSDHNSILIKMKDSIETQKQQKITIWNTKNPDSWLTFKNETENTTFKEKWDDSNELNKRYNKWKKQLKSLMYKHLERITIKKNMVTNRKIKFLTKRRKAVAKEIEKLKKKGLTKGIIAHYMIEKQQQLKKDTIMEVGKKENHIKQLKLEAITNKAMRTNEIWEVRKNNYKRDEMKIGVKSKEGILITSSDEIKERYAEYYAELLHNRKTKEEYESYHNKILENHQLYEKIKLYDHEKINSKFTKKEMAKAMKDLKKNKSPGPDQLYNEIIINAGSNLQENMLNMINAFWKAEQIPDELYEVEIKSLYKGKGDICNLENQRGLFLNSNIIKFLERMILNRATPKMENKMSPLQAGGRKGFSIREQVFIVRSIIDRYEYYKQEIYLQFIDLKKAFDKMVVKNVMQNLWECEIRGKIWRMIYNINRKAVIKVKINSNTTTENITIGEVLKQGSVLAANLAALHTASITEKFHNTDLSAEYGKQSIPLLLFQDDIVKFDTNPHNLQKSNVILETFQNENKMEYHCGKTVIMTNSKNDPTIFLNNQILPIVEEYKYLGDIITTDNNLQKLIYERKNNIAGTVAEIVTIIHQTQEFSIIAAKQYLQGIIIPKLLLNAETWTKITPKDISNLEQIQSQSLKRLLRIPYSTPTKGLYSEIGILSIEGQINEKQLMFLHSILNKTDNSPVKEILKEQRDQPGNTWYKNVKQAMENIEIKIDDEEIANTSKNEWKRKIKEAIWKKEQGKFDEWKQTSTKCKNLKNIKMKNYITSLSAEKAKVILEMRLGMLNTKENYKGKFKDTKCRNCKKENETTMHLLNCITENKSDLEHLDQVWKLDDMVKLNRLASHLCSLVNENEHLEYQKTCCRTQNNTQVPNEMVQ